MAVVYVNPGDDVRVRTSNNGNYQNSNNRNNNSSNGNYNNSSKKNKEFDAKNYQYKKCGAEYNANFTYVQKETGEVITKKMVKAWFIRQGKFFSVVAFEDKNSSEGVSENGNKYYVMTFEVSCKETGMVVRETGCFFEKSGCVYLRKSGILINTKFNKNGAKGWAGWWSPNTKMYKK